MDTSLLIVGPHCRTVSYDTMSSTMWKSQGLDIDQTLNSQKTTHISPSQVSYQISVVTIFEELTVLWYHHTIYTCFLPCRVNSGDKEFINQQILCFFGGEYPEDGYHICVVDPSSYPQTQINFFWSITMDIPPANLQPHENLFGELVNCN